MIPSDNLNAKFASALIAINIALPMLMSAALGLLPVHAPRILPFLACVLIIFVLNMQLEHAFSHLRWWIRMIQTLNLLAAFLMGCIAAIACLRMANVVLALSLAH